MGRQVQAPRPRALGKSAAEPLNSSTLFLRSRPREAPVADHVARVACNHQAAGVPLVCGQEQLRREALRLHQRLVVDHDQLALVRPAVPLQEDPRALVAQQPQLRATVGGRAVVGHLQLAPARPVLRKRSSEKSEVLVTVSGVGGHRRRCPSTLRRLWP